MATEREVIFLGIFDRPNLQIKGRLQKEKKMFGEKYFRKHCNIRDGRLCSWDVRHKMTQNDLRSAKCFVLGGIFFIQFTNNQVSSVTNLGVKQNRLSMQPP